MQQIKRAGVEHKPARRASITLAGATRAVTWAALAVVVVATSAVGQQTSRTGEVSLDSLLNTRISVAAKYLQTSAEAAASITIVSAEDIRRQGYSNLQEVLESVPGMYVSNDRNYPYLGTRGFGRPTDYNNRVLVLIDGHTLNEPVFGSAPIGSDLPINLDAVERVEVVRGPGSAIYGGNAMFAVINVVMKAGTRTNGTVVDARAGSATERQGAFAIGYPVGSHSSFSLSALLKGSGGQTLTYPEFRSLGNPRGIVRDADREDGMSIQGGFATGNLSTRFGYRARTKGVPTGSYGTIFGDRRAQTFDESYWGDIVAKGSIGPTLHTSVRFYADRGQYRGKFPYDSGPVYTDRALSVEGGTDGLLLWDTNSRNRLTLGTELHRIFTASYQVGNFEGDPATDNSTFNIVSFFAQDELQLHAKLKLVGGLRFDHKLTRWQAVTPRVAIVATPTNRSTIKLLYGEAYRPPSVVESELNVAYYRSNASLRAERIKTTELAVEQRLWSSILLGASAYDYSMRDLIEPLSADTLDGFRFTNAASTTGRGVELSMNYQPTGAPLSLHWWYAAQQTHDDSTGQQLTNSPQQTLNAATAVRGPGGTHAAVTLRHETGRRTLNGESTPAFTRTDLNIGYAPSAQFAWRWLRGTDISIRASNLFNTRYAVPGGLEHVQQSIQQDGRMLSLRFRREFQ